MVIFYFWHKEQLPDTINKTDWRQKMIYFFISCFWNNLEFTLPLYMPLRLVLYLGAGCNFRLRESMKQMKQILYKSKNFAIITLMYVTFLKLEENSKHFKNVDLMKPGLKYQFHCFSSTATA